ncbi:MAG: hypothetical protein BGP25_05095 [Lysobacterales bacterium 63-13]|nr:MAG: hypothetical protein BGP25_05095 [Xanthomonadales bacterium 63-13]
MLSTIVGSIIVGLFAMSLLTLKKSAALPPVPKVEALPKIDFPMEEATPPAMLEADMPPAMLEAGSESVWPGSFSDAPSSCFERRVTSTGHSWFRPILEPSEITTTIVPVHHAVAATSFQMKVVDTMLALCGVHVGYGPLGRVILKQQRAVRSAPAQAVRMPKRALKAIQLLRSPS